MRDDDWYVDTRVRSTGEIISRAGPMAIKAAKQVFWSLFESVDYEAVKVEVVKQGEDADGWARTETEIQGMRQSQQ